MMIIADETDEAALAKWNKYREGTDHEALSWVAGQASKDTQTDMASTAKRFMSSSGDLVNMNQGTLVGSYQSIAEMVDELSGVEGLKGVIQAAKGRVAVTTFSSNVGRIVSIARAARDAGRQCLVLGRSLKRVIDVAGEAARGALLSDLAAAVPGQFRLVHGGVDHVQGQPVGRLFLAVAGAEAAHLAQVTTFLKERDARVEVLGHVAGPV